MGIGIYMLLINRKIKKIIASTLIFSFLSMNCTFAVETVITPTGQTATTVTPGAGGNFDIHTNTTVGDIGVNAFNKFDVGQGDTVNLHLNNEQNKLFNLIYDKSASQIDGVVNPIKTAQLAVMSFLQTPTVL